VIKSGPVRWVGREGERPGILTLTNRALVFEGPVPQVPPGASRSGPDASQSVGSPADGGTPRPRPRCSPHPALALPRSGRGPWAYRFRPRRSAATAEPRAPDHRGRCLGVGHPAGPRVGPTAAPRDDGRRWARSARQSPLRLLWTGEPAGFAQVRQLRSSVQRLNCRISDRCLQDRPRRSLCVYGQRSWGTF